MAEEEEDLLLPGDLPDATNHDDSNNDFVMQANGDIDPENVDNLFGTIEEEEKVEFKEGEETDLLPILEEGEDEEKFEDDFEIPAVEEDTKIEPDEYDETNIFPEDDEEAAKAMAEYMEEEKAVAARLEQEKKIAEAKGDVIGSADEQSLRIKEVGIRDRYDLVSRTVSGDFLQTPTEGAYHREPHVKSYSLLIETEFGEEEEGKVEEEEEEEEKIEEEEISETDDDKLEDREPYYELYKSLMKEFPMLKMKNNFLQRKMAEYFKRRKMEHVLRESERIGDAQAKYYKKLDALWELRNTNHMQRSAITTELNEMKELRDNQLKSVVENFEAMQIREREIGTGLIFTKTAKEIPEKFLERLLKNQRTKSKEIVEMRLCFIKLRNNIEEITAAIKAMDKIGENHTLIDYEQLKMENQNHADKIEERDEELQKLRTKCAAAIQALAHLREKSSSTDIDILEMSDKLDEIELDRSNWRERVNDLKQERDTIRANIIRLQEESGLLTKPKLLLDMEDTLGQIERRKQELKNINTIYNKKAIALDAIRKNIEEEKEYYHPQKAKAETVTKPKLWKGKPRLVYPSLEKFNIKMFQKY